MEDEQQAEANVVSLIKELQKQITYLERKIDTLIAQSGSRQPGPRNYSRPSRGYGERKPYDNARGGGFTPKHFSSGRSYDKKRGDEGGRYQERKKPFRPGDRDRQAKKFSGQNSHKQEGAR
jgi:hypothetical protein